MADTLPKVSNGTSNLGEGQDVAPTPGSNDSKLPKIRAGKLSDKRDSESKDKMTKADRERKKAQELKNQPKDFFKLISHPHVEGQKDEIPINDYYKRFLGNKIDRMTERSIFQNTQSTGRTIMPEFENMMAVGKKMSDVSAFVVQKETFTSNVDMEKNLREQVDVVQKSIDTDFEGATTIPKTGRTSLYQTIINNNDTRDKLRKKMWGSPTQSQHGCASPYSVSSRKGALSWNKKKDEQWGRDGAISSSQHLFKYASNQDTEGIFYEASNLYLPPTHRLLGYDNRLKAERKLKPLPPSETRKLQIERDATSIMKTLGVKDYESTQRSQSKRNKHSNVFKLGPLGNQSYQAASKTIDIRESSKGLDTGISQMRNVNVKFDLQIVDGIHSVKDGQVNMVETFRPKKVQTKAQKGQKSEQFSTKIRTAKKLTKRASFSMTQTKYNDAKTLWHPLKEVEGPILNDLDTIAKMKNAKRYPVPEKLLHKPNDWNLFIDSIMHTAYNSDENDEWANTVRCDIGAPANSMESMEFIDFESSSDEEENRKIAAKDPIKSQIEALSKENKTEEVVMYCRVHTDKKAKRKKGSLLPAILPPDTKEAQIYEQKMSKIKIHKDALELHGFDLDLMESYPHKVREGDIPTFLLKDNIKMFQQYPEIQQRIELEFKHKNLFPTDDYIQLVFEQFCNIFDCSPLSIQKYFHNGKLSYENYTLSMSQAKAIACTIPLLPNLKEIYFYNNNLSDQMCTLILMAAFQNPCLNAISIEKNNVKRSASNTYKQLLKQCPDKITKLTLTDSCNLGNHLFNFITDMGNEGDYGIDVPGQKIHTLDLSKISISSAGCQHLCKILINQKQMRNLDLSSCNIHQQGTRYVLDGLNRNRGIQNFNFSCNDMQSKMYEFSIKMAKILSRHDELMHVNLDHTGLQKEEVIFIGMTLPVSKSIIALHLSANGLGYYDRVFLRTLINAKLVYKFKNMAQDKLNGIRSQSEKNMIGELGTGDYVDDDLRYFMKTFQQIETQKLDLDEDINSILCDVDIVQAFDDIRAGKVKNAPLETVNKANEKHEILNDLIEKIKMRQMQIESQKEKVEKFHDQQIDLNDPQTIENFKTMGLYNQDKNGNEIEEEEKKDVSQQEDKVTREDIFLMSNALKIDRIRLRVQQDALKQVTRKGKSVGEMALHFMGINKIAYDMLMDNPMTGYTEKVIFTRILGNEEIEDGDVWKDTTQCWVCEHWQKQRIEHLSDHKGYMKQNIKKLAELDSVLKKVEDPENANMIQVLTKENIVEIDFKLKNKKALDRIIEKSNEGTERNSDNESLKEEPFDKQEVESFAGSDLSSENAMNEFASTNPMSNTQMGHQEIRGQLPQNFAVVQKIEQGENSDDSLLYDSSDDERVRYSAMQGTKSTFKDTMYLEGVNKPNFKDKSYLNGANSTFQNKYTKKLLDSNDDINMKSPGSIKSRRDQFKQHDTDRKNQEKYSKKVERNGVMYRIVERKVFHQGIEYTLEDEVKIDSDEETSIHTSVDQFEVDDDEVVTDVKEHYYKNPAKKDENLEQLLSKNGHAYKETKQNLRNVFGRKQIFLVASYNDWIPVEMKSIFEIKMEKQKGDSLAEFIKQNSDVEMKSSKASHNIIQSSQYIPPGRHFFYFIFNRKRVILSPNYSIIRFKGTNVFLNQIEVKKREEELKRVTLTKNFDDMKGEFKKERTVFRTFQDDTEEYMKLLLLQDVKYSKILKLCKYESDRESLMKSLEKHYFKLKNIFMFYISKSESYPTMNVNDLERFCYTSKIFDRNMNKSTLDRHLIATNVSNNPYKNSADRVLNRYEFMELLVRIAQGKYKEQKQTMSLGEAFEMLCTKDVLHHNQNNSIDGMVFRDLNLYQPKVHELIRKNETVIKKLFESNLGNMQKYLHYNDVLRIIKKANFNISDQVYNRCFIECQMSRVDTIKDDKACRQMKYVEFIVMICRIAHELYVNTKQESMELHEKIDSILEPLLNTALLEKVFTFDKTGKPTMTTGGTEQSQDNLDSLQN